MRQRRVRIDLYAGETRKPQPLVGGAHQRPDLTLRHSFRQRAVHCLVGLERDMRGEAHQLELVRVLDHPAACGDRRRTGEMEPGCPSGDAVAEHELRRLLDAEASRADTAISEPLRHALEGALIFLPRLVFESRVKVARAIFLERGTHAEWVALGRQDDGKKPLAVAPAHAGEIEERGAARQQHRVELAVRHQPARCVDSPLPLVAGDGPRLVLHRRERCDARWQGGGAVGASGALGRDA